MSRVLYTETNYTSIAIINAADYRNNSSSNSSCSYDSDEETEYGNGW